MPRKVSVRPITVHVEETLNVFFSWNMQHVYSSVTMQPTDKID
jgi:hypothetical protein